MTIYAVRNLEVDAVRFNANAPKEFEGFLSDFDITFNKRWDLVDVSTMEQDKQIPSWCRYEVWDGTAFFKVDPGDFVFIANGQIFVWDSEHFWAFFAERD